MISLLNYYGTRGRIRASSVRVGRSSIELLSHSHLVTGTATGATSRDLPRLTLLFFFSF